MGRATSAAHSAKKGTKLRVSSCTELNLSSFQVSSSVGEWRPREGSQVCACAEPTRACRMDKWLTKPAGACPVAAAHRCTDH